MKGLITFTILEFIALVAWMNGAPAISAGLILAIGLFLEHIVAFNDFKGAKSLKLLFNVRKIPWFKLLLASITEAIIWILWLMVALAQPVLGAILLFVGIFLQHNAEINIFVGKPTFKSLLSRRVLGFTLLEVGSGVAWLALITAGWPITGALVLAAGLFLEHKGQGKALAKASNG